MLISELHNAVCGDCCDKNMFCWFAECVPGLALLHDGCVSQCPPTFYVESRGEPSLTQGSTAATTIRYFCSPCHHSCLTCSGPNDDECISCHQDQKLHRVPETSDPYTVTDKAHCYPVQLLDTLNRSDVSHRILLAIIAVSIIFIVFILVFLCCCRDRRRGRLGGGYDLDHDKHGWLINKGHAQPYKRISREDDDDDEYEYYDSFPHSKMTDPRVGGRRPHHSNQTNLELISEDEEDDGGFEKLSRDLVRPVPEARGEKSSRLHSMRRGNDAEIHNNVIPTSKVPFVGHDNNDTFPESSDDMVERVPLV